MELETGTAEAKKAYVAYVQLNDLLAGLSERLKASSSDYGFKQASPSYAKSFNMILVAAKTAFKLDEQFLESVHELREIEEVVGPAIPDQVVSQGRLLRGALRAFITCYMAPGEKTKIGFHSDMG